MNDKFIALEQSASIAEQLLQEFLKDNISEPRTEKLFYQAIETRSNHFGDALFLDPVSVISNTSSSKEKFDLELAVEKINLASFAHKAYKLEDLKTCINAFFVSVSSSATTRDTFEKGFYGTLRLTLLGQTLRECSSYDKPYSLKEAILDSFPSNPRQYFFVDGHTDNDNIMKGCLMIQESLLKRINDNLAERIGDPNDLKQMLFDYVDMRYTEIQNAKWTANNLMELDEDMYDPEEEFDELNEDTDEDEQEMRRAIMQSTQSSVKKTSNINSNASPFKHTSRKAPVPWTPEEIDALEMGLIQYKSRKWSDILKAYPVLKNRGQGQLKDKARSEIKRRERDGIDLGGFYYAKN
ncbi:uncharacterized protein B0P05DRAFT_546822 [Gilbertella persicaria]|uniref:uncharacterized protein n=1 Tax=Gilbertella persicaria TaxID=101096 RepID=UPI002220B6D1|nr:uncharacterized protein B0P05DRAFT_546822 [Gilbertella persicaria]KAI8075890.1 hypothetical protein B0P05DRAFT_546822 [Gilbertella persicaria]